MLMITLLFIKANTEVFKGLRLKKNATATVEAEATEQISTCNNKTEIRKKFETPLCSFTEATFSLRAKIVFCHRYL